MSQIFNLKRDTLEKSWRREYFSIEAETLEEAVQKVRDDIDFCDWSDVDYCDDICPSIGNPTQYIIDNSGNEVWNNGDEVKHHEVWTQSLRDTKENVKAILQTNFNYIGGKLSWAIFREIVEELGWVANEEFQTNGYQIDYWENFTTPDGGKYKVSGCMWTDEIKIEKGWH